MNKIRVTAWMGLILSMLLFVINMMTMIKDPIVSGIGFFTVAIIFLFLAVFGGAKQKNIEKDAVETDKVKGAEPDGEMDKEPDKEKDDGSDKEIGVEVEKEKDDGKDIDKEQVEKTAQEALVEYKRRLSHSVRMPIAIISGYGDLIEKKKCKPEEEEAYIKKICQNIKYLNLTYRMLLEEKEEDLICFDVCEVLSEYVDQISEYVIKKEKKIEFNQNIDEIKMCGNPTELIRIFYNMTENSLKYMQGGTGIRITVDRVGEQVMIIYRDDGAGVNRDEVTLLTKENYQGSNAVADRNSRGYGLHMIKELVEKWNGELQIKSAEGKGFTVYFFFPLANL